MRKKRLFYFSEDSRRWVPYKAENLTLDLDEIANQYEEGTFEMSYKIMMMDDKEYNEYIDALEAEA